MAFEELLPFIIIVTAISIAVLVIFYITRLRKPSAHVPQETSIQPEALALERWRHRSQKSVSSNDAKEASDELRTLGLEREILSDAIYWARNEGMFLNCVCVYCVSLAPVVRINGNFSASSGVRTGL